MWHVHVPLVNGMEVLMRVYLRKTTVTYFFDFELQVPFYFYNSRVNGLCGNFNGKTVDDSKFTLYFFYIFRANSSSSL